MTSETKEKGEKKVMGGRKVKGKEKRKMLVWEREGIGARREPRRESRRKEILYTYIAYIYQYESERESE